MIEAGIVIAGKYRVVKKLGEGAMGSVWLAKNQTTDREFAIKVLLPAAAAAPSALARFFQEARVCGALRHPSILEIYDAGSAPELDGAPYLVMERLDGAPLDVVLSQRKRLSPRLAVDVIAQIARGLQLAHAKGIVHRDLKPANIFLHRSGTGALVPKVLDFGISKMIDQDAPHVALTQSTAILGSPLYMSPEQMDHGKKLDGRSDVHALGLLLWECLCGTAPFTSSSYNLLVVEIMKGPRPTLREVMPEASVELARIVERAFAIEVGERFPSATALADALDTELGRLGGELLSTRHAAIEVLGGLDLTSRAPPPLSATEEPLSFDHTAPALLSAGSKDVTFAETGIASPSSPTVGVAASTKEAPGPSASSQLVASGNAAPEPRRASLAVIAAGFVAVLVVAVGAVVMSTRGPTKVTITPTTRSGASSLAVDPSMSASAATAAPITTDSSPSPAAPSSLPLASAAPSVARAPATTAARPPSPVKKPSTAATAATGRPRIDQSGL